MCVCGGGNKVGQFAYPPAPAVNILFVGGLENINIHERNATCFASSLIFMRDVLIDWSVDVLVSMCGACFFSA